FRQAARTGARALRQAGVARRLQGVGLVEPRRGLGEAGGAGLVAAEGWIDAQDGAAQLSSLGLLRRGEALQPTGLSGAAGGPQDRGAKYRGGAQREDGKLPVAAGRLRMSARQDFAATQLCNVVGHGSI